MITKLIYIPLCQDCLNFSNDGFQFDFRFITESFKYIFPVFIALLAGLIALYQVKSNTISSARIRWIEDLRASLSDLYPATLNVVNCYQLHDLYIKQGKKEQGDAYYEKYSENLTKYNSLSNKIKMQLNSNENDHKRIEDILDEIDKKCNTDIISTKLDDIENMLKEIVSISKSIFKKEWEKSKQLFKI